jgi:hypothetical protein
MTLAGLLLWTRRWVPPQRRDWIEALAAEADDVPPGGERLAWLVGGLWLVAKEARMIRKVAYIVAGLAGGVVLIRLGWHDGSTNPAVPVNRGIMITVAVLLAALPWLLPVAPGRTARIVRAIAYAALCAFYADMVLLSRYAGARFDDFQAADQDNWNADVMAGAVVSAVLIIGMFAFYAVAILLLTSRRAKTAGRTLALAACAGAACAVVIYAMAPFGGLRDTGNVALTILCGLIAFLAPIAILVFAGRLAGDARQGVLTGMYAGGIGALVLAAVTIGTMLLFPHHVTLIWANPSPAVPHGTDFEWRMSVGDGALKYQLFLLLGPVAGLFFGAIGASLAAEEPPVPEAPAATQLPVPTPVVSA